MSPLLQADLTPPERPIAKAKKKAAVTLDVLKKAIGIVLVGGSAAWAGGEYAARGVSAEVKMYAQRAQVLEQRVMSAEQSAIRAEVMLEMLLKREGIAPPPKTDAGVSDGGVVEARDGGIPF